MSESIIKSVSLQTDDTLENHASEGTNNTSLSLENNVFSKTRPTPVTVVSEQCCMLVLNYYDQIISGSTCKNLQSLMYLAKKIGGVRGDFSTQCM